MGQAVYTVDIRRMRQRLGGSDGKWSRVRRQRLASGMERHWQVLSLQYSPPYWLRGASVIEVIEKVRCERAARFDDRMHKPRWRNCLQA